ncbi:MAG TPA: ABC transporter ATP-binding protein [Thermoplasmata archaeon]
MGNGAGREALYRGRPSLERGWGFLLEYDVEVQHLVKVFDNDVTAVNDVSFKIERGRFFTLLGPSGSGKSTVLRMIGGLERPTRGEVLLGGSRVTHLPPYLRNTSMVFQSLALFPHLDVAGNIAFGLRMRRVPEREITSRVTTALGLVELPGYGARRIWQLSGGERQRVALARALVTEPRVLLLDEPLGALDLKLRRAMQVELKKLQKRVGITFIFVTHDQEEALTMSDDIGIMNKGRIEQVGDARAIYERPATKFVAGFIGETNLLDGEVTAVDRVATVDHGGMSSLAPANGVERGQRLTLAIRPEKIRVGPDAQPCENRYEGRVVDEVYTGSSGKLIVELDSGHRVTAQVQIRDLGEFAGVGSRVQIGWHPENVVVVR